ncbi:MULTISPECIES: DUF86 domain-containing protein [unclassified Paenibacillus]|uniref:DUF86 domain-containing protein n=1 Tax=unclassified Paenibacillus TaxID=185978 RepID=UPI0008380743|nr:MULTISPECIES: HepT-like ribonuclease domain-containing protein [unclassified Paenibacillus]NWL89846.1 DUF86 domain-containing protein [Paenibacillus sp. 79R4]
MYYVNREQIERRLDVIPEILQVCTLANTNSGEHLLARYAEERAIHLAIEVVTDVGSYLIDGFIMRDASSYEDIVDIMMDEQVVDKELGSILTKLVRLRRPLVQSYFDWDRSGGHELVQYLDEALTSFADKVRSYLDREAIPS